MKITKNFSLSTIVLFSVGLGLAASLLPVVAYQISEEYKEIRISAEREGDAALDMLESVHANAMAFRLQTEDNDPAIDTLNGTLEQFSKQSSNVRIWLVMSEKVMNYQLANNQNEVEGPLDKVDEAALSELKIQKHFTEEGKLRITRPVVMGKGSASSERCASCHTGLMDIQEGEAIGALSAEVDTRAAFATWQQSIQNTAIGYAIVLLVTLGMIFLLLRSFVLKPIANVALAADQIANNSSDAVFEGSDRPDAMGQLSRSLNVFQKRMKERIGLELQAEHSQALAKAAESSDKAKSEFLANMSHEIRTPMNGVMGMAELLAKTELDGKQRMFTDVIVKSGASLLTIINDILDFSKLDAGQMQLHPEPFRIREAIEDVATLVSSKVAEKDLELIVRVDPAIPEMLVGDVGRIRQVVTNLMGNAVKFTEQGHVYVNVDGQDIPEEGKHSIAKLRIAVEDTGIGIPEDKVGKVFDKFSQVDTSATRKHEGTGLGLSICQHLVELMGGTISADSENGVGSTFWFEIDLPIDGEQTSHKTVPVDVTGSRILIVDDNEVNRSILKEQMAMWKFDCAAVSSGAEALAIIAEVVQRGITIDAIVMDYHMPQITGGDTVKELRANPATASLPVIMLTSVDETEDGKAFSSLGIQAHLTKPTRSSLLLETIIQVLQKDRNNQCGADDSSSKAIASVRSLNSEKEDEKIKTIAPNVIHPPKLHKKRICRKVLLV